MRLLSYQPVIGLKYTVTVNNSDLLLNWLTRFHQLEAGSFDSNFYCYQDKHAVAHLYRVACGLDSLVLGEPQILGQIKQAFATASQAKSC